MEDKCGDDLVAARRFMNLCHNHMREIFSGGTLPLSDVIARLGDIQSHAKIMRARSVYKAAQTIVDDLMKRCSVQDCAGSVLVLQRLIKQYDAGLSEMMPKTAPVVVRPAISTHNAISPMSERVRQKQAGEIMKPLVKFADKIDQVSLVSLLSLAANDQAVKLNLQSNKIDYIMPSLTNHLLRLARTEGKSVSVSYASDNTVLDEKVLRLLKSQMESAGKTLIQKCVEAPITRLNKGQNQSAHLAITSQLNGGKLDVLMSCEGVARETFDTIAVLSLLTQSGVQSKVNAKDGLTRLELFQIPLSIQPASHSSKMGAVL